MKTSNKFTESAKAGAKFIASVAVLSAAVIVITPVCTYFGYGVVLGTALAAAKVFGAGFVLPRLAVTLVYYASYIGLFLPIWSKFVDKAYMPFYK